MILLLFAFLCGLVLYYVDRYMADDVSKKALIPGFKAAILLCGFILVLVDVTMFIEMNRLIVSTAGSVNGSCVSYDGNAIFYPATAVALNGTLLSGNAASLGFRNDGNIITVIEGTGNPGARLESNFTNVTDFDTLFFSGYTDELGAAYTVDLLKTDGSWATVYAFSNSSSYYTNTVSLNGSAYLNGSTVTVRVISTKPGNVSYRLYMDWLTLSGTETYTAYCPTDADTQLIFIYHRMENSMVLLILNQIPLIGMFIFGLVVLQVILMAYGMVTGKKGGPNA